MSQPLFLLWENQGAILHYHYKSFTNDEMLKKYDTFIKVSFEEQ